MYIYAYICLINASNYTKPEEYSVTDNRIDILSKLYTQFNLNVTSAAILLCIMNIFVQRGFFMSSCFFWFNDISVEAIDTAYRKMEKIQSY